MEVVRQRKAFRYRITVEPLGTEPPVAPLEFAHDNHDDILLIVERMRRNAGLDADAAAATALGLKLLAETMLAQRGNPLFDPLREPIREFIHTLKSQGKNDARE